MSVGLYRAEDLKLIVYTTICPLRRGWSPSACPGVLPLKEESADGSLSVNVKGIGGLCVVRPATGMMAAPHGQITA